MQFGFALRSKAFCYLPSETVARGVTNQCALDAFLHGTNTIELKTMKSAGGRVGFKLGDEVLKYETKGCGAKSILVEEMHGNSYVLIKRRL